MNKYNFVFLASSVVMSMAVYASSVAQPSVISAMKDGKHVECVGVKKLITPKKVSIHKGYKVDITVNESGDFEATEQDTSDLGGYSPIPYPCKFIDGFSSTDLNIANKKVFVCKDDSYGVTKEVYLLENCVITR